jgi:putative ABC transport system permease protein
VLPADRYKTSEQLTEFVRPLLVRVKSLPGVIDAGESNALPPINFASSKMEISGKTPQDDWRVLFQNVSEEYFRVLGIRFKQGRAFSEAEVNDARKVAVVNETFVHKYLPNENSIGQRVRLASLESPADPARDAHDTREWFEIIGVVGDVTNSGLQVPIEPEVWTPYTITASGPLVLFVRTSQDPGTMMNAVQQSVWATDAGVALAFPGTLEDRLNKYVYAGPRFGFLLMTIFGCIGLVLVTVGVYSVLAYATARKTQEIGIRMALGAERGHVLGMVVRTGLRLVVAGMALGIAISSVLGRVIGNQLVGVTAYDPATLAATMLLLMLTATVACWLPARRAARVNPTVALRYQ